MNPGVFAHWPNRITALRFLGALALFAILAVWGERESSAIEPVRAVFQIAFWLFIATALSDVLDGWLARRGNLITTFGRIADPFVDKVLVLGAMIFLAVLPWSKSFFPAWIVVTVLAREFLVTGIRGYVESLGKEFPADAFGKVKMLVQCFAIGIVLGLEAFELSDAAERAWAWIGWAAVLLTLATSVGSGLNYVVKLRRLLSEDAR